MRGVILCADDGPTNRSAMRMLSQQEHRLIFACDGRQALDIAQSRVPDLILMDVVMPPRSRRPRPWHAAVRG
jgi:putative two-component system response regulator